MSTLVFGIVCLIAGIALGLLGGYLLGGWNYRTNPWVDAEKDAKRYGVGYIVIKADKHGRFEQVRINPTQVVVADKPLTIGRRF